MEKSSPQLSGSCSSVKTVSQHLLVCHLSLRTTLRYPSLKMVPLLALCEPSMHLLHPGENVYSCETRPLYPRWCVHGPRLGLQFSLLFKVSSKHTCCVRLEPLSYGQDTEHQEKWARRCFVPTVCWRQKLWHTRAGVCSCFPYLWDGCIPGSIEESVCSGLCSAASWYSPLLFVPHA